jgi:hypothetical protein
MSGLCKKIAASAMIKSPEYIHDGDRLPTSAR